MLSHVTVFEWELGDRDVVCRPDAGDRGADVELARLDEHPRDVGLVAQVGLDDPAPARCFRPLAAAVVVDDDLGALGCEEADTGGADPARAAGDEHASISQTCLHLSVTSG